MYCFSGDPEISSNELQDQFHSELIPVLLFLDNVHLALCADQMRLLDENGEKLGKTYLDVAEKKQMSIEKSKLEDHVLHPALKYFTIKMRILLLQQNNNVLRVIKNLYRTSKNYSKNCDMNSIYCFCAHVYFERVYLSVFSRFGEVDNKNKKMTELKETFDNFPQHHSFSFVKFCFVNFFHQMIEMSIEKDDVMQTDWIANKMLENEPNLVMKTVAWQYQAVVRLNTPKSFFTTHEIKYIEQIIEAVKTEWLKMQENENSAAKHHRYFIFLIHATYTLFQRTEDEEIKQKFGEELLSNFEENCFTTVMGSLEFANVDIAKTYLEVCLKMQKYDKISNFCKKFLKGKSKISLPFEFRELLNVAQLISSVGKLNASGEKNYLSIRTNLSKLQQAINIYTDSCYSLRKKSWLDACTKFQYEFHKEMGSPEEFHKLRLESNFLMPTLYDRCCSLDMGSNGSLITTITEVEEVAIKSVKFILVPALFLTWSPEERKILQKFKESYERLKDVLIVGFQLTENNFIQCDYGSRNWVSSLQSNQSGSRTDHSSYIIIFQQVAGNFILIRKMYWIMCNISNNKRI